MRRLLALFALCNALLYAMLMPLWEGFDESFHFGYVQSLANGDGLPNARTATVSREIEESIWLAPASHVVRENLPRVVTYAEFFSFPAAQRAEIARKIREIPRSDRHLPSQIANYEAHHPPLAYALLALPERWLATLSLPVRVLILRWIAACAGAALLLQSGRRLFIALKLDELHQNAALFCLLSAQMTWASIAHVANDWLAIPLAVWLLVATISGSGVLMGLALGLGLLTKAYFLAFVPLVIGVCLWRRNWKSLVIAIATAAALAGPWYVRNVIRYGTLTGMQETRSGVDLPNIMAVPWTTTILTTLHQALWTGNNSFTSFSVWTLNAILALAVVALFFCFRRLRRRDGAVWITVCYIVLFGGALVYDVLIGFVFTHGRSAWPSPWYTQVLMTPLLGLIFLGSSRGAHAGRIVAALLASLFGYVIVATYLVKLIPLYGGYEGRGNWQALFAPGLAARLDAVTLAPSGAIFAMAGVVVALTVLQLVLLLRALRPLAAR